MQNLNPQEAVSKKVLMIRLSSFGDVVLSMVALEVEKHHSPLMVTDWLTTSEFVPLLKGHPRIRKVLEFSRSSGLRSWILLCRKLWDENYDVVFDLHNSLRTKIARFLFFYWGLREKKKHQTSKTSKTRWSVVNKQRLRLWGYFLFKKFWPGILKPTPVVSRFAQCVGGTGHERPKLNHLVRSDFDPGFDWKKPYYCVMASSAWRGKIWETEKFFKVISRIKIRPVILGKFGDYASHQLQNLLKQNGIEHVPGVGKWSVSETATLLSRSHGYFGNDTGFAHLAEAVGVPAYTVYGPTTPDMGFGGWRKGSMSFASTLWCRPCGKDGRYCFRLQNKYLCLTELSEEQVKLPYESIL